MRKLFILATMFISAVTAIAADGDWSGTGSRSNPYLITSVADLKALAKNVNGGTSYRNMFFRQTTDIDLSGVRGVVGWIPIGAYGVHGFDGSYEGGGHVISGMYINNGLDGQGLFGFIDGGSVSNVIVTNCDITANNYVGGIVGYLAGTVSGCAVKDGHLNITGTFCNGGGVAGTVYDGTVSSCLVSGCAIESNYSQIGGIAGSVLSATINDCSVDATMLSGGSHIGAIIGASEGGTPNLRNNHYTTSVKGANGGVDGKDFGSNGAVLGDVVTTVATAPKAVVSATVSAAAPAAAAPATPAAAPAVKPADTTAKPVVAAVQPATATASPATPATAQPQAIPAAAPAAKPSYPKDSESYIVKTSGVKKSEAKAVQAVAEKNEAQESGGFMGKNFRYHSMCDWQPGMRFMVIPEKYDMLVNTFCDAATGKEVSSSSLRHHIMVYKGHEDTPEGRVHVNFSCENNSKNYYYELPAGTFENYCFGKMGVPTLAYLGDVDKARELLMDQVMLTRTQFFRVDTESDGDGYKEITVDKNKPVTVKAIGVGTRNFPVKIIVEDEHGTQFYQCVVMSKTNCGMRDDEFSVDNEKFLFEGSFEFTGAETVVSENIKDYMNKTIHTKYAASMSSKGSGKVRDVKVPRFTGFIVDDIQQVGNTKYYTLTLREQETRRIYYKDVTFKLEDVEGDSNTAKEDYFGYVFALGDGVARNTSLETRTAIREGRVIPNMTKEEVEMAMGEASSKEIVNGVEYWLYPRTNSVLVVEFTSEGIVNQAKARAEEGEKKKQPQKVRGRTKKSTAGGSTTTGTPL